MTIKLSKASTEESTYIVTVSFFDTARTPVTPRIASWTLKDQDGAIVNNRDAVDLTPLGTTATIVLTGDDLALPDTNKPTRYLLIEALYDSTLYGTDLHLREEGKFTISNLVAKV
jgi:hypothetical protein